jgi:hypothetical protein
MPVAIRAHSNAPSLVRFLAALDATLTQLAELLGLVSPRDEDAMAARSLVT